MNIINKYLINYLINNNYKLSIIEILTFLFSIIAITFFIAPVWGPGGESWSYWVAAKIFNLWEGFPILYYGPLYNFYLKFFLILEFPISVQLEHFVTHIFCYFSIFMLLNRFLPAIPSLIICCSWIPNIWVVQGGSRVMAMALLSIYFSGKRFKIMNKGVLPLSLIMGCLVNQFIIPFMFGHLIGVYISNYRNKVIKIQNIIVYNYKSILIFSTKVILIILYIFTTIFQSKRIDNNAQAFYYPWAPIPQESNIISWAYFSIGNGNWIFENIPEKEQPYNDWYYTHSRVFNGAQNISEYILTNPWKFIKNIFKRFDQLYLLPSLFTFGFNFETFKILNLFLWLMAPFIFYKLYKYYINEKSRYIPYSMVLGTTVTIITLFIVRGLLYQRYTIVLLPVALLFVAHISRYFEFVLTFIYNDLLSKFNYQNNLKNNLIIIKVIKIVGLIFIVSGIVLNEWLLIKLFSPDGIVALKSRIIIWSFNILNILIGIILYFKNNKFALFTIRIWKLMNNIFSSSKIHLVQFKKSKYSNYQSKSTLFVNCFLASSVFYSSFIDFGTNSGILNVGNNPYLLKSKQNIYYHDKMVKFLKGIKPADRILSNDSPLISAYSNVDRDNVYHSLFLPPFYDNSEDTKNFLNSLNLIVVSDNWSTEQSSLATQEYLRYYLHIKPFIEKVVGNGWSEVILEGYGKIYTKL